MQSYRDSVGDVHVRVHDGVHEARDRDQLMELRVRVLQVFHSLHELHAPRELHVLQDLHALHAGDYARSHDAHL